MSKPPRDLEDRRPLDDEIEVRRDEFGEPIVDHKIPHTGPDEDDWDDDLYPED